MNVIEADGLKWLAMPYPLSNGALVMVSARGIEEIIEPPTHCPVCLRELVAGACDRGHDPWDL